MRVALHVHDGRARTDPAWSVYSFCVFFTCDKSPIWCFCRTLSALETESPPRRNAFCHKSNGCTHANCFPVSSYMSTQSFRSSIWIRNRSTRKQNMQNNDESWRRRMEQRKKVETDEGRTKRKENCEKGMRRTGEAEHGRRFKGAEICTKKKQNSNG